MKRLLVFILIIVYLFTTTGATMHMHFCMGKLDDWSLWSKQEKKTCGKCGMKKYEKPNGCCSDEDKWVKIADDQKASNANYQFSSLQDAEAIHPSNLDYQLFYTESADLLPQSHAPPVMANNTVYLFNCSFRI